MSLDVNIPLSDGGIASMKLRCGYDHDLVYAMELGIIDDLLGTSTLTTPGHPKGYSGVQ